MSENELAMRKYIEDKIVEALSEISGEPVEDIRAKLAAYPNKDAIIDNVVSALDQAITELTREVYTSVVISALLGAITSDGGGMTALNN